MKDSSEKMSPLRRRMIEDMRMHKLSTHTQSGYIRAVRHFAGYWLRPLWCAGFPGSDQDGP
jgi:hypothetical protein